MHRGLAGPFSCKGGSSLNSRPVDQVISRLGPEILVNSQNKVSDITFMFQWVPKRACAKRARAKKARAKTARAKRAQYENSAVRIQRSTFVKQWNNCLHITQLHSYKFTLSNPITIFSFEK